MKRTRIPVFHRFWGASILFALFLGFPMGTWTWMMLNGVHEFVPFYIDLKAIHLKIQIFVFFGLFIAGFALQSGAHVLDSKPPRSERVIWIYPLILTGVLLSLLQGETWQLLGHGVISLGNLLLLITMIQTAIQGTKTRLLPIALLFVIGFSVFTIAPWLDLTQPAQSFFVVWSAAYVIVLAAGQQLVANVLGAKRFTASTAWPFALAILGSVVLVGLSAFTGFDSYELVGFSMILPLLIYIIFLGIIPALIKTGPTSLALAFAFSFLWVFSAAITLIVYGPLWDAILHQLALGSVTTLILAVGARVLGFFSGKAPLKESTLTLFIIGWQLVPFFRGWSSILALGEWSVWFLSGWVEALFTIWGIACFLRVMKVLKPDQTKGQ